MTTGLSLGVLQTSSGFERIGQDTIVKNDGAGHMGELVVFKDTETHGTREQYDSLRRQKGDDGAEVAAVRDSVLKTSIQQGL